MSVVSWPTLKTELSYVGPTLHRCQFYHAH